MLSRPMKLVTCFLFQCGSWLLVASFSFVLVAQYPVSLTHFWLIVFILSGAEVLLCLMCRDVWEKSCNVLYSIIIIFLLVCSVKFFAFLWPPVPDDVFLLCNLFWWEWNVDIQSTLFIKFVFTFTVLRTTLYKWRILTCWVWSVYLRFSFKKYFSHQADSGDKRITILMICLFIR